MSIVKHDHILVTLQPSYASFCIRNVFILIMFLILSYIQNVSSYDIVRIFSWAGNSGSMRPANVNFAYYVGFGGARW